MYESQAIPNIHHFRSVPFPRPPPCISIPAVYSFNQNHCEYGSQNTIIPPLNPQSNEAIKVSYPLNRPVPSFRHGQGLGPVDCHRPVQHRAVHREQLQITRTGVADGDAHGEKLCARIGNIDKCNFGKLLGSRSNNLSSSPLPDNERRQGV